MGPVGQAVADAQGGDDGVVPVPLRLAVGQALRQEDVLLGAQGGQQVEGLEDEAEAVAAHGGELLVLHAGQVLTSDEHAAGGGGVQARQAVQESGLARAGGAHDGHELAASHHQARRVQGDDPGLALAVDLGQAAGLDDVHRGGSSGRCPRCSLGHPCSLGGRSGIGSVAEGRGLGLSRHLRTLLVWLTRVVGRAGRLIRVASGGCPVDVKKPRNGAITTECVEGRDARAPVHRKAEARRYEGAAAPCPGSRARGSRFSGPHGRGGKRGSRGTVEEALLSPERGRGRAGSGWRSPRDAARPGHRPRRPSEECRPGSGPAMGPGRSGGWWSRW